MYMYMYVHTQKKGHLLTDTKGTVMNIFSDECCVNVYTFLCMNHLISYYTSIKNNCLKLKNEVGMEVLKSKQTRVAYRDNQHIHIVHPYACFLIGSSDCVILLYTSIHQYS